MKTCKELREDRVALLAKASAIADMATKEKRELTDDESKSVDSMLGPEIEKLDASIARAEKIEARAKELAAMAAPQVNPQPAGGGVRIEAMAGPINMQRHGSLKAYTNREEAFRAGCWFASTILNHAKATEYCQQMGIQNAASAGSNAAGGFLVPEEMERSLIRLVETYGVFRQNAQVMPMSSDTLMIPRRTAGVTAYYVAEVPSSITESSPTLNQAQLIARVLAVRTLLSRDLVEDAIISVVDWVTQEIALAFAKAEDDAGWLGDGSSTYGGIVGCQNALAAGSIYTAASGHTGFSTLTNADFMGIVGTLPRYALPGAKWYFSQFGYWTSAAALQAAAGGNNIMDLGGGPVMQYMGFPVVISQSLNATAGAQVSTTGLCYFGNLSMAATIGSRRGIQTQILNELYAATRQIGIITTQRFDINVHERGTASVAGPLVALKTPAS